MHIRDLVHVSVLLITFFLVNTYKPFRLLLFVALHSFRMEKLPQMQLPGIEDCSILHKNRHHILDFESMQGHHRCCKGELNFKSDMRSSVSSFTCPHKQEKHVEKIG